MVLSLTSHVDPHLLTNKTEAAKRLNVIGLLDGSHFSHLEPIQFVYKIGLGRIKKKSENHYLLGIYFL